jgi:hypothetical protein
MADPKKPTQETNHAPEGSERGIPKKQQDGSKDTHGLLTWINAWIKETRQVFTIGWMYAIPIVAILWTIVILIYAIQLPSGVR